MAIQVGDRIPDVTLRTIAAGREREISTAELFAGKRAVLFAVPGAFTPTCSDYHLPGFVEAAEAIKGKGIDLIACVAVNDHWVMEAWAKAREAGEKILMLADGNGDFARAMGMENDSSRFGLGTRSRRYAAVIEDRIVKVLSVDQPGRFEVSSAEKILEALTPE
ncbi:MAG TPA: peroxiredoxin [Thermoanaerobaculia bacterium]|nr:peroxiredoxin [Thermoanaerobaculia bacterium]